MSQGTVPVAPQETASKPADFDITQDEAKRLEECFKDPKFRDLMNQYVKEISNPETKLQYEEYLKQMESEGNAPANRKLMKPEPAFCIKAKRITSDEHSNANNTQNTHKTNKKNNKNKNKKKQKKNNNNHNNSQTKQSSHIFINCCSGELVKDAKLSESSGFDHPLNCTGSKRAGLCWQIPYVVGHPRYDKDGNHVYDIAFSKNTIENAQNDATFKNVVVQTCFEGIQNNYTQQELQIYTDPSSKKYKILKTIRCKGGDPPLMSVNLDKDNQIKEPKRLVETHENKENATNSSRTMQYKIVESHKNNDLQKYWNDNRLIMEELNKRPQQIFIHILLPNVDELKQIKATLNNKDRRLVTITTTNGKYDACRILLDYPAVKKSMSAQWFTYRKELKLTFDVEPHSQQEIDDILKKFNIKPHPRNVVENNDDDQKEQIEQIEQKESRNNNNSNIESEKKEKEKEKKKLVKPMKDFAFERREKYDRISILFRVTNIFIESCFVEFTEEGLVKIQFETHEHAYYKVVDIEEKIDISKCKFNVNCKNLLIMVVKEMMDAD